MDFNELVNKRRSVRGFTDALLTDGQINKLIEAATAAPNACNYQSWHFYVVRGRKMIAGLVPSVYSGEWLKSAAAVFVVCTDAAKLTERFGSRGTELFAIQDTACAADHLMLMAAELGIGSCFVGAFDEDECRKYLNIPKERRPVALVPVGFAKSDVPKRARKPVGEVVTFIGEESENKN
jgi:nitroreductase